MDELKMMMCRAIVQAANDRGEYDTPSKEWSKDDFEIHNVWKDVAAAIRAIEEAGFAVVPKEPTAEMKRAAWAPDADEIWGDMLAASPLNLEEPRG